MASFSMATAAVAALQAASTVVGQQQAAKQASERDAQAQAQVDAQNAYLQQQENVRAKQQRDLLNRQLAATRARLAAGGIGGGGSGQALMEGMVRNSEGQLSDNQALLETRMTNAANAVSASSGSSSGNALVQGLSLAGRGLSLFGGSGNGN